MVTIHEVSEIEGFLENLFFLGSDGAKTSTIDLAIKNLCSIPEDSPVVTAKTLTTDVLKFHLSVILTMQTIFSFIEEAKGQLKLDPLLIIENPNASHMVLCGHTSSGNDELFDEIHWEFQCFFRLE